MAIAGGLIGRDSKSCPTTVYDAEWIGQDSLRARFKGTFQSPDHVFGVFCSDRDSIFSLGLDVPAARFFVVSHSGSDLLVRFNRFRVRCYYVPEEHATEYVEILYAVEANGATSELWWQAVTDSLGPERAAEVYEEVEAKGRLDPEREMECE